MRRLLTDVFVRSAVLIGLFQMAVPGPTQAQLTSLPRGGNKRASVSEQIGLTDVIIRYSRPGVKNREGHIWGELIPAGYSQLGYGFKKPAPWRAGANENTTIEFSTDVLVEGQALPAGKYGFFIAYGPEECTLIFSKNATSWGNFFYDPAEDALQVKVKTVHTDKSVERLKYEFGDQLPSSAVIQLQWEKVIIPFKVQVDLIKTQLASFRRELRSDKALPGLWQPWHQAAEFCLENNTNLEEGLLWADSSLSGTFGGAGNFDAWLTKAGILDSMGRKAEAAEAMKKALPLADDIQGYTYGVTLVGAKRSTEAMATFKWIYDRYPNTLFTNIGMASGYSALGDYKTALTWAKKALPQAKGGNKIEIQRNIRDLEAGKDMNN
jgi:tetratricopeptide (TPR) repeat protein